MTLELWRGNRLPLLTDTITSNDTAVDLTGSTVLFYMRNDTSAALKINGSTATITSAPAGQVSYSWSADDVDTVGDFYGWWTVNESGLSQDTPEFSISIVEHAPASIRISRPVAEDGSTTIYKGDAYLDSVNRALQYELQVQDGPDLTGTTLTYRIADTLEKTMTLVGEDAAKVDLTSAETATLVAGSYLFEIDAIVSAGATVTLLRSDMIVLADMDGP